MTRLPPRSSVPGRWPPARSWWPRRSRSCWCPSRRAPRAAVSPTPRRRRRYPSATNDQHVHAAHRPRKGRLGEAGIHFALVATGPHGLDEAFRRTVGDENAHRDPPATTQRDETGRRRNHHHRPDGEVVGAALAYRRSWAALPTTRRVGRRPSRRARPRPPVPAAAGTPRCRRRPAVHDVPGGRSGGSWRCSTNRQRLGRLGGWPSRATTSPMVRRRRAVDRRGLESCASGLRREARRRHRCAAAASVVVPDPGRSRRGTPSRGPTAAPLAQFHHPMPFTSSTPACRQGQRSWMSPWGHGTRCRSPARPHASTAGWCAVAARPPSSSVPMSSGAGRRELRLRRARVSPRATPATASALAMPAVPWE